MSADRSIERFESVANQETNTKALIEATRLSFQIIEPWAEARSENNVVTDIIVSLRQQADQFFTSINRSYENAQSGYSFSKKAQDLCTCLLEPSDACSNESIQDYIREMQQVARKAHEEATNTSNLFRANRQGFNSVTAKIPVARESIGSERAHIEASGLRAERRAEGWGRLLDRFSPLKGKRISKESQSPLQIAGTLISLPVVLPLLVVASSGAMIFSAQAKDRQRQLIEYGDAIKTLESAIEKLQDLMEYMDILADYWREMDAILEDIHGRVAELRQDALLRFKIRDLKRDWNKVGIEYFEYKKELEKIQASSPTYRSINKRPTT